MGKLIFSLVVSAALTFAAPVTYSSLSSWQAAGPQSGTIGFESLASSSQMQYASAVLSGVTFTGVGGNLVVYPSGYVWSDLGAGPSLTSQPAPGGIQITLPANTFGFGFIVGSSAGVPVSVILNGQTGSPLVISNPTNPPPNVGNLAQFWGVRDDVAITSITLAANTTGYRVILDNFTWGGAGTPPPPPPTETPEASTALLIGGALVLIPFLHRNAKS